MTATRNEKNSAEQRMGRPRDGSIRKKVIEAAIQCYAERGWSGFNFDAVSVRAKVGRPAMYRRWASREDLLIDTFRELTPTITAPDHGNVRDDLLDIAVEYRRIMAGDRGHAGTRLFIEKESAPEVYEAVFAEITANRNLFIIEIFKHGQARGEIRSDADLSMATELLIGALMLDTLYTKSSAQVHSTVERVIDTLLNGLLA